MNQPVAHEQIAVRYASDVAHVWGSWEPALRRCERLLVGGSWRAGLTPDELAGELRRAQYRVHTAAEFAAGLAPPASAAEAHAVLVESLGSCRDALGVLAVRADMDELRDDIAELGAQAIELTREAFDSARSSSALVHAWVAEDQVDPDWLAASTPPRSERWAFLLWLALGISAALCMVALVELAQRAT